MFWRRRETRRTDRGPRPIAPAARTEPDAGHDGRPAASRAVRHGPARAAVGARRRLRSILGAERPATDATWDEVEEALIAADVGGTATLELVDAARERFGRDGGRSGEDARRALATEIRDRLAAVGLGHLRARPGARR